VWPNEQQRLSACTPHYIRCIKPNDKKLAMTFVAGRVEHQVKYLGLLENVKVKRAGYAYRHFKDVFLGRFGQLCDIPPTVCNYIVLRDMLPLISH
jgi:myosin heavy subunit